MSHKTIIIVLETEKIQTNTEKYISTNASETNTVDVNPSPEDKTGYLSNLYNNIFMTNNIN